MRPQYLTNLVEDWLEWLRSGRPGQFIKDKLSEQAFSRLNS
jgi:hypothetical protein